MFRSVINSRFSRKDDLECGFSTAEWVVLMGFTILLLAWMVQGLYVENVRATTISTLRDSAKVGAREGDLESAFGTGSTIEHSIINECELRIRDTLAQVTQADTSDANCQIGFDSAGYFVEARVGNNFKNIKLLPGAEIFNGRISNLSARYYSTSDAS